MKVVSVNEGGTPSLKSDSINKLVKLNENLDLCDIWRIRNPQKCKYISRQKYLSEIIQRQYDCIFISQNLQEFVGKSEKRFECSFNRSFISFLFNIKTK